MLPQASQTYATPHPHSLGCWRFLFVLSCTLALLLPTYAATFNTVGGDIAQAALLPDAPAVTRATAPRGMATALKPPMQFEPNLGQTDPHVKFMARGTGYTVFLTPTKAVLVLPAVELTAAVEGPLSSSAKRVVQLQVLGANPAVRMAGVNETPTTINRLIGADPTQWQTQVPVYAQVHYDEMYPGIDLLYYGNQQELEYDFIVHPGADPSVITLGIQGADQATLDKDGHLLLTLEGGTLRLQKPVLSQTVAGQSTAVQGNFVLREPDPTDATAQPIQVAFAVGAYDPTLPLIIDPLVNYASALGGEGQDIGEAIALDNAGHGYLVGTTDSFTFPVTPNALQDSAIGPDRDIFVTKFNTETSEILFSTYIGGEGEDHATGVAVDAAGIPYVTGHTTSLTFPTQTPLRETLQGARDAFVLKLAAEGSNLLYSTYLGGTNNDHANGIVVDQAGQASLTGTTASTDFPTVNAIDATLSNGEATPQPDAFVTTLDAQGTALQFSTFLGGTGKDVGHSLTLDAEGKIYLTGETAQGTGFPVTADAFQSTYGGGGTDAFVATINPSLAGNSALQYASYLGGSGEDVGLDLLVDAQQQVYLTGWTTGQGAAQAVVLRPELATAEPMSPWGRRSSPPVAVNPSRDIRGMMRGLMQRLQPPPPEPAPFTQLSGSTPLPGFPVTSNAYDATFNGAKDAFLAHVNVAASGKDALVYATYVGGSQADTGTAIGLDSLGRLCIAGTTASADYPMNNPLANQGTLSGGTDVFATKFQPDPTTLLFSSFLGGSANDTLTDMRLDNDDNAYLTGQTRSTDFPLLTALNNTTLTGEPQAFVLKVQDPIDIAATLIPTDTYDTYLHLGEDQTWRVEWENTGPDPATGVQVVFEFEESGFPPSLQFQSLQNISGPSTIDISSCSGSALSGPGGTLTCAVSDLSVSPGQSAAALTFTPVTDEAYYLSVEMVGQEVDTDPSNNEDSITGEIGNESSLTVDFQGSGAGSILAVPGPGGTGMVTFFSRDGAQTFEYPDGTMVSLTATALGLGGNASTFSGWSGTGCTSPNETITVNMTQDRTCTVTFTLTVTVPNVVGQTQAAATAAINGVTGLSVGAVTQANSATVPSGNVISQDPTPGQVPSGSTVALVISTGPAPVTVPNVVGQAQAAATAAINAVTGLSVGAVTQANSATVPSGNVISQDPTPGQVPSGSTVALVISTGPAPVTVPNVVGQTQAAATAAINAVTGLSVGAVTQANSATVPSGNVISQDPTPGQVPSGSTVALVISTGPASVTVPNVVGQTQAAATAAINAVTGLSVGAVTQANSATVPSGNVISQDPTPGQVPSGSTVALVISTGPASVTVPNVVGQTQAAATAAINAVTGLSVGAVTQANSATVPSGNVISQDPTPGQVPSGSTVALVISTGPASVTVPNVVGQTQAAATAAINGVTGLSVGAVTQTNSATVPSGNVISQDPTPGQVPSGSTVALVISTGPAPVTVPNVVGQTQAAATAAINAVTGLSVGAVTQANSATVPSGNVISQDPTPGQVPSGSTVALVISTGPAPVTVPNVVGQAQAAATAAINAVTGLSVGAVTQANSATVPSGNVISQDPTPGQVPSGSTVALVISTGPAPVTVPNVVGQTQAAATAAINAVTGLSVGAVTQANSATVPSGNVISQDPTPGQVPSGSTVALVISTGPASVTVPNVVGQTQAAATAAINAVTGLSVGAVTQANSATVPSGNVISQDPTPGQVPSGSTVALVVSSGPVLRTLTVAKIGNGSGTVTGPGINCGSDCGETVNNGTPITLTAAPSGGSTFTRWTGCDSMSGTQCNVTITSNRTVTVTFTLIPRTLTITRTGSGSGTVTGPGINCGSDCTETVNNGTSITLTATPNSSFFFTGWTVSGSPTATCPGTGTCTITMNINRTITATFAANQAPNVDAGSNQVITTFPVNATLTGTVTDDGLPIPPTLTSTWTLASGPGVITIANAAAVNTTANFTAPGAYVLQLSTSDGVLSTSDTVIITINDPTAPQVTIPNVVGQTQQAATASLTTVSLTLGTLTQQLSDIVPAGSVIRQDPPAGSNLDQGTPVDLVISSGSELLVTSSDDAPDATPGDGVCTTSSGTSACTLRAAVQEANASPGEQTIRLPTPTDTYPLTLAGASEEAAATGDLDFTDDVIIESITGNAADVVISGEALDRVIDLPPGTSPRVTLRGLTIQGGMIVGSTGGGLRNAQGTLTIEDSEVTANQSNGSGGGLSQLGGTLILRNTMVTNNTSQGLGGGLQAQSGTITIDGNTQFMGNTANFGGGLSVGRANVTVSNTLVENNTAVGTGGGIYKFLNPSDLLGGSSTFDLQLSNVTVRNNTPNNCEGNFSGCQ